MRKKAIKIILGLVVDCAVILSLFLLIILFCKSTLTNYRANNVLMICAIIIAIFYIVFACFNRWKTPGIKLMTGRKESLSVPMRKIALASFLDWFLIFSFTLIINLAVRLFIFIDTIVLFTIIAPLYYIVSYLIVKQTFGYYFCSIELVPKRENSHWIAVVLKRELLKFGLGAWLPLCLLVVFRVEIAWLNILFLLLLNVIVLLFYYIAKGEAWWNTIGKTQAQRKNNSLKSNYLLRFGYIAFIALSFLIFLLHNNTNNTSSDKFLGFNIPFKRIEYPNNGKVKPYVAFLNEHAQNPKEYLLSLFDKYDIVILCENLHTEDTQWDFIYDVVTDTQFVNKVGHIFTEYGCAKEQAKVDSFIRTSFPDSISLAKAVATLMCYHSGNFYFFMQKLHTFNQTLPDSLQIQVHFTDILSWKYLRKIYSDTMLNDENTIKYERDSLMARVVMDWYKQTGGKCLLVTNYRHAFAVKNNVGFKKYENEAQYIYNEFPEITANVLIHGYRYDYIYISPPQHGLWNRAIKNNGNNPVGFNFENSPFGKDKFDMYPALRKYYYCRYQDVFTGFVFYKPEEEYTHSTPYYRKYAAEKEYEWAMQNNLIDSAQGKTLVNSYSDTGGKRQETDFKVLYINAYHFIDLLLWGLWAVIVLLVAIGSLLRIKSCSS